MNAGLFFRILCSLLLGWLGWWLAQEQFIGEFWLPVLGLGGAALGFAIAPYVITNPMAWLGRKLTQMPTSTLIAGVIGLLIALLISAFITLPLSLLPGAYGRVLPLVLALFLSYAVIALLVRRAGELFRFLGIAERETAASGGGPILVDTSALIDGRIADVTQTGFVIGQLVIPSFVLRELQYIADSADPQKRRRGRRGMDMVGQLQSKARVPVRIEELELNEGEEVDAKLVKLAKEWNCSIMTTDFNLNRVAELQGIRVLNLNNLANSLKPVVLPGEEMELRITQEGKEAGQGVGFLDDGTMVVVDGGKRFLNSQVWVVISRVLQTAMGRMIFAQIKDSGHERRE